MITRPVWQGAWKGAWRPLWSSLQAGRVLAILVDPADGYALITPTGEAWVQWIKVEPTNG